MFGRKPQVLLDIHTGPNIKISGTFKDYYELLNKRLLHLHKLLLNYKLEQVAIINKGRQFFPV